MRGELLSPGPKLKGRTPGPRSVDGAAADTGGMVYASCALPGRSPHPASPSNASIARVTVGANLVLPGFQARLEYIVSGAGEGGFGEPDIECRAYAHLASHGELPAVQIDYLLADGEPEPAAPGSPRAVLVHSVEPIEEIREILFGDADPCVRDADRYGVNVFQYADLHACAGVRVLHRV